MSKIIIINGQGGVGKDEFVKMCQRFKKNFIFNFSTVDLVKDIAKKLGWKGEKTPEARKFLSDLKDLLSDSPWGDLPLEDIKKKIRIEEDGCEQFGIDTDRMIFFIHAREPKNIEKMVKELGAKTLLIRRAAVEQKWSNHADDDVFNYDYDYVIDNDGTLEDLQRSAKDFINLLFK